VSDTPRTDAKRGFHDLDTAVDAEFSEQLERELAAANERINRLEEAGDAMLNAWLMPEDSMEYCDWVALSADAKAKWHKAKEAKP
jgi:hypothetical protein